MHDSYLYGMIEKNKFEREVQYEDKTCNNRRHRSDCRS